MMSFVPTKSRLSREQAAEMLRHSWREVRLGRLRALLDFHLPYHLFQISVLERSPSLFAIDAVSGELDLYQFDEMPELTRDRVPQGQHEVGARLSIDLARERLLERTLRMIFLQGFFKRRQTRLKAVYLGELHLPYWVGLFERRGQISLEVIDASRGKFEGAKMRQIVSQILEERGSTAVPLSAETRTA